MPAILFIWHKFFQPLIDRWYGKPQLESGNEGDGVEKLGEKVGHSVSWDIKRDFSKKIGLNS